MAQTTPASQPAPVVERATWLYARLLRLCPAAFRLEYGEEVTQVFRLLVRDAMTTHGVWGAVTYSVAALGDLLVSAFMEYFALVEGVWKRSWMMNRMRSSAIVVFCAYIVFVLIGMGFQKSSEDVVKSSVGTTHPGVSVAYYGVMAGAVIALLATLVGGLPIAYAALRQAFAGRRWGIVALFAVPPIALLVWLGWTWALLNVFARGNQSATSAGAHGLLISWIGVLVLAAILSVLAVSVAISRSELRAELFRFALAPEIGVALGMLVTVGAIAFWAAQLLSDAPSFLNAPDGPVGLRASLGQHVIVDIAVMSVAMLVVIVGIARGFAARRAQAA